MTQYKILFAFLTLIIFSCEREKCFNCKNYDMETYNQNLENFKTSFEMCEFDGIWDEITWYNNDYTDGGELSVVDLDVFIVGWRAIDNPDIDGDGIINDDDDDMDGDGIMNEKDITGNVMGNNIIQELIICSEK